jgi:hypothetical protein
MDCQFLGLDLGQTNDPSALVFIERPVYCDGTYGDGGWQSPENVPSMRYVEQRYQSQELHLRALRRYPLRTSYPAIVQDVGRLLGTLRHPNSTKLLIDWTGVGRPVFDMFVAAGLDPIGISIHGGDQVIEVEGGYRVPKRDLVGAVQAALGQRRLRFAADLPLLDVLQGELQNFKVKIDPKTAHDSYSAWRENQHDDTVLATAIATWYADRALAHVSFSSNYLTPARS